MLRFRSVVVVFSLMLLPDISFGNEQRARLELRVDQKRLGVVEVIFRGVDVMTRVRDLESAGIDTQGGRTEVIHGVSYVSLKSLTRSVDYQMNESDLVLALTSKPLLKPQPSREIAVRGGKADRPPAIAAPKVGDRNEVLARLALYVDGNRKGEVGVIVRDQEVLARVPDVGALGATIPTEEHVIIRGVPYVALSSLSSRFSFTFDQVDLLSSP